MQENWSEPSPNLPLVLNLFTILPAHDLHGVGVGRQELTIIYSVQTALDYENNDLEKRYYSYEVVPFDSGA